MRKSICLIVLLAFVLMAVSSTSFAQDSADEHNFCLNGTWYCPDSENIAREEWNWGAAWYWGLYKAGEIPYNQIPDWARLHQDSDGDGVSDDADLCPNEGGIVDATGCPIPDAPATSCQIEVSSGTQSGLELSSPIVDVPLDAINGLSDPDATYGATPYGFNWLATSADWLQLFGPNGSGYFPLWNSGFGWGPDLVSNNCPTPTPPSV